MAISLGVDAVGLIAVPGTPRCVSEADARILGAISRGGSRLVLVLMNPTREYATRMISACQPDLLQFHGDEQPEFAESFERPYVKVITSATRSEELCDHRNAWAWMLDTRRRQPGDREVFRSLCSSHPRRRMILAGELTAGNIPEAISGFSPWGVDVSRGIERSPREKDYLLMKQFVHAARNTNA